MEYDELMLCVDSAFAEVVAPADDNIVCHDCPECTALRADTQGRRPSTLSDEWIEKNFDQLPLFSSDAKRYFLPAFLRIAAFKPDSLVAQFVLYALSSDFRMQPSGGYSEQQQQAVQMYLRYIESSVSEFEREHFVKAWALWHSVT